MFITRGRYKSIKTRSYLVEHAVFFLCASLGSHEKAAELLVTEDLTVAEISYKVGINDPYYFSKVFKNQFGIAPSVYQKNGGKAPTSNTTAGNTEQPAEEKGETNA